ncbi:MAG: chromate efflux transporter [Longimicrobiales bacterium]
MATVLREWGRIGCLGFGGPPAHIAMLRQLCVRRRRWLDEEDFEHGVTATNLLPGPASTQLAIYCAWRLAGVRGALLGGLAFILPGLVAIIALAALFLGGPPAVVLGLAAGAGAVVAAVAVRAGGDLVPASWSRAGDTAARWRWAGYLVAGAVATILVGPWLVLVLLGAGAVELVVRLRPAGLATLVAPLAVVLGAGAGAATLLSLAWTSLKVGALSYGGGFVIVPLMQADAVAQHGWMSDGEFLNAVALGQATPGPVVQTVAVVGYAAAGLVGALLAAVIAFAPSFWFITLGARRFESMRTDPRPRAFLGGAGPAAIGAILGSAVPLALALGEGWQWAVLAGGAVLLALRVGVVPVLLAAAAAGAVVAAAGGPLPL